MANEALARTFAQAIFEKAVERWRTELRNVNTLLARSAAVASLDNPAEPFERKKEKINNILPATVLHEVRNLVYLLASANQLHLLPQVATEFDRLSAVGPTRPLAQVASAIELDEADRKLLESKVRAQFGAETEFAYRVDKALLGGVVVRVGDKVIDASVSGKLAAMKQKLEATR